MHVIDKKLYKKVKHQADKKFRSPTGVYKSSWIVREYKRLGGRFSGRKPTSLSGLKRWYREKWIDLNRPIRLSKNGHSRVIGYAPCGRSSSELAGKYPICRPSKIITKKTPVTYKELSLRSIKRAKKSKSRLRESGRIKFGGTGAQYYGKRSSIMVPIPKGVKQWAKYAFKLHDLGFLGAIETGWKRAKQLSTKDNIPIEDLRYMRNWFARHRYTSYPTFKKWNDLGRPKTKEWHNRRGIIAWITWGGDPAFKWINSQKTLNLLNKHFNKTYKQI